MQSEYVTMESSLETVQDLPEIFDRIVLVSHRNRRARVGQAERPARTVLKLDFESALASWTDFILPPGGIVAGPAILTFMFD